MVFHIVLGSWGQVCYCPQGLTDSQGKIVWSAHYRAYGQLAIADVEEIINPIRFQGQYHDLETGLYYNRHRYYDPHSARFTTIDPIGLAGGLNNYQYVPNPTGWVDPLGLASCKGDCPTTASGGLSALDDITRARVESYAEAVNSDEPWKWREFGSGISRSERAAIKQHAEEAGLIPRIPVDPNTRYADFSSVLIRSETLPEHLWGTSDRAQFNYLDDFIGGRPKGTTWHHHQDSGRMELVPFGIHNITSHSGGRTTWASGKR